MSSWARLRILPHSPLLYLQPLLPTILSVILLLSLARTPAQAGRITFNTVEDRTTTGSIAHDCGFTAIVWMQEQTGPGWNLMWVANEGMGWFSPLPVESAAHEDYAPRTMTGAESQSDIHAVWQRQTGTGAEIMHGAHPFGQSWSVEPITANSTEDLSPDIASRFDGRLHVTWVGLDPKSGEGKIFYGRKGVSPPGPWTVELLTESHLGPFWTGAEPKIEISEHNDVVHIVYRGSDPNGYHTHYARRDASGVWLYQVLTSPNGEDLVADVATGSPFFVNSVTVAMSGNNCFGCQARVYVRKSFNMGLTFQAATLESSIYSAELGAVAAGSLNDNTIVSAELSGNIFIGNLFLSYSGFIQTLPPENGASFSPSIAQVTCIGLSEDPGGLGIAFTNHGSEEAPPDSAEVWALRGRDPSIAVEDPPHAPPAQLALTASPNPFSSSTIITATAPLPENEVELNIYDSLGRLVRRFTESSPDASRLQSWHWNGRDATGRLVPSGVFFVEMKQGPARAIDRLIRIR